MDEISDVTGAGDIYDRHDDARARGWRVAVPGHAARQLTPANRGDEARHSRPCRRMSCVRPCARICAPVRIRVRPLMPPPPLVPGVNASRLNATAVTAADQSGAPPGGNGVRGARSRGPR